MKRMALATVQILLDVDVTGDGETADVLTAILTEQMRKYAGNHSALIDWQYVDANRPFEEVEVADNYQPDADRFPVVDERDANYLASAGEACPACQCRGGVDTTGKIQADGIQATQTMECDHCKASWTDLYKLIGIIDFKQN